jgi:hypothetical protein
MFMDNVAKNSTFLQYSSYDELLENHSYISRNSSGYEDCVSFTYYEPTDLVNNGAFSNYWLGTGFSRYLMNSVYYYGCSKSNGGIFAFQYSGYNDITKGIRPVVTLKARLKTSGQVEQVVGTNGTTKAMVWQLIEE